METDLMSGHATARVQQRGIPSLIVDWLLIYGATAFDHRGAEVRYFDHAARRRLEKEFGRQVVDRLGGAPQRLCCRGGLRVCQHCGASTEAR